MDIGIYEDNNYVCSINTFEYQAKDISTFVSNNNGNNGGNNNDGGSNSNGTRLLWTEDEPYYSGSKTY
jgi:hypothetical protein